MGNQDLFRLERHERETLEAWLVAFDLSWREDSLDTWAAQELPGPEDPLRRPALSELVKIDLERQWQTGRELTLESYLNRFPELGTAETVPADLILAEYAARRHCGASAELSRFAQRFPQQADELAVLVQQAELEEPVNPLPLGQPCGEAGLDTSQAGPASDTVPPELRNPDRLSATFGRYRILKKLGQGGMGTVYLAHDTQLQRQIALKVPRFSSRDDGETIKRFLREARTVAKLKDRHICPLYDVGEQDGVPYITMAYVDGPVLADLVGTPRLQSERSIAELVRKIASGVSRAHRKSIVHRDLKPSNIMLDEHDEPIIMDFGLARPMAGKLEERLTHSGAILGTPAYMSREQIDGHFDQLGPASDVYSLGVILYELLTGQVPYQGPLTALIAKVAEGNPTPPSELRAGLDGRLEAICLKMMASEPDDRYASAAEAAVALDHYLQESGVAGTCRDGEGKSVQDVKPAARIWAAVIGVIVLGMLASGFAFWGFGDRQPLKPKSEKQSDATVRNAESTDAHVEFNPSAPDSRDLGNPGPTPRSGQHPPRIAAPFDPREAKRYQQAWADRLALRVETTNSIGMKLVLIPPGEFMMGRDGPVAWTKGDPSPRHLVRITRPFYLGKCEVTQRELKEILGIEPWIGGEKWSGGYRMREGPDVAAACVSWGEMQEFCAKLGSREGQTYRMPTEAEWEYACRAGSTSLYYFGDDPSQLQDYAWYERNSGLDPRSVEDSGPFPLDVGQKTPNAWGLYDMLGNLCERCSDWLDAGYYSRSPIDDPQGPSRQISEQTRVIRGASWGSNATWLQVERRDSTAELYGYDRIGFRVVAEIRPAPAAEE